MPYATLDDLVARFGAEEIEQLTDREGRREIEGVPVDAALADADALIESYLASRYAVPVSPVPVLVRRLACDVARFFLHGNAATEAVRTAYADAVKMLEGLAAGSPVLPGATPAPTGANPAADTGRVVYSAPDRVFAHGKFGDFFG